MRRMTADEMVQKMRTLTVYFEDGTFLKPVVRMTEKGARDYANRMYWHYCYLKGEEFANAVTIVETMLDDEMNIITTNTWHA